MVYLRSTTGIAKNGQLKIIHENFLIKRFGFSYLISTDDYIKNFIFLISE